MRLIVKGLLMPMINRTRMRVWHLAVAVIVAANCAVVAILMLSGEGPSVDQPAPSSLGSEHGRSDSANRQDNHGTDRNDSMTTENDGRANDRVGSADLVLEVRVPGGWNRKIECTVQSSPLAGLPQEAQSVPITLSADRTAQVSLSIAAAGVRIEIVGDGVVPMLGHIVWVDDKSLRMRSRAELLESGEDALAPLRSTENSSKANEPHPAVAIQGGEMAKNALHVVELLPLVPVSVTFCDSSRNEFNSAQPIRVSWVITSSQGGGGLYTPDLGQARGSFATPTVRAPVGARLSIVPVASGGFLWGPARYDVDSVPAAPDGLSVQFTLNGWRLGRAFVVSEDETPLSTAQFWLLPGTAFPYEIRLGNAQRGRGGEYAFLISDGHATLDVWAPSHRLRSIPVSSIPADGEAVRIVLSKAWPVMHVEVDFGAEPPDQREPVAVEVSMSVVAESRQVPVAATLELPVDGKLTVYGTPPRIPMVKPTSDWYEFELIEKGEQGGVPVRRFTARRRSGLLVLADDSTPLSWGPEVLVTVQQPISTGNKDGQSLPGRAAQPVSFRLSVGERKLAPVSRGDWVVRIHSTGEPRVYGEARVSLVSGIVEVAVQPTFNLSWRLLQIIDRTGHCMSAGTMFVFGSSTLAGFTDARSRASELLVGDANKDSLARRLMVNPILWTVAHAKGEVMMPVWAVGTVLVHPAHGSGLYEGRIDIESMTITVGPLTGGAIVTFVAASGASDEQKATLREQGWFVAIREYNDLRDIERVDGTDYKIAADGGAATFQSFLPGTYVAYYVRAREEDFKSPETDRMIKRVILEWFDAAKFEVAAGHATTVALPVSRE